MPRTTARTTLAKRITSRGRRLTKQRVIVAQALAAERQAVSGQELYERLHRAYPRLGLATIYRALEAQVEAGVWRPAQRPRDWYPHHPSGPENTHTPLWKSVYMVE